MGSDAEIKHGQKLASRSLHFLMGFGGFLSIKKRLPARKKTILVEANYRTP
jgi:hypothetical protein